VGGRAVPALPTCRPRSPVRGTADGWWKGAVAAKKLPPATATPRSSTVGGGGGRGTGWHRRPRGGGRRHRATPAVFWHGTRSWAADLGAFSGWIWCVCGRASRGGGASRRRRRARNTHLRGTVRSGRSPAAQVAVTAGAARACRPPAVAPYQLSATHGIAAAGEWRGGERVLPPPRVGERADSNTGRTRGTRRGAPVATDRYVATAAVRADVCSGGGPLAAASVGRARGRGWDRPCGGTAPPPPHPASPSVARVATKMAAA